MVSPALKSWFFNLRAIVCFGPDNFFVVWGCPGHCRMFVASLASTYWAVVPVPTCDNQGTAKRPLAPILLPV